MIPKTIHYCWFGGSQIPKEMQSFIDDWKVNLIDYNFKLWTESNFNIDDAPIFVKEAYQNRKYAFVADYARLKALYTEGGIYLDTDVKVVKDFAPYLFDGFFSSIEYHQDMVENLKITENDLDDNCCRKLNVSHIRGIGIQSAMFGAEKGHPYIKDCLDYYEHISFIQQDGSLYDEIILPDILALCAEKYGFKYSRDKQTLKENIVIYPQYIFAGRKNSNKESVAIHCAHNSWRNTTILQKCFNRLAESPLLAKIKNELTKNVFLRKIYNQLKSKVWFSR